MEKIKNIIAFVTQKRTCEKIISKGFKKAKKEDSLFVANIVNPNENFLYNNNDGDALEYLYTTSKKYNADLTVIKAEDTIDAMVEFILENKGTHIVLGASPHSDEIETHPIVKKLRKRLTDINYIIV